MKKKRWFRNGLLSGAFLIAVTCNGQADRSPTVRAELEHIRKTGFYRIVLPPQLVAKCRPDLADLRVCRSDGNFYPYVLKTDLHSPMNTGYLPVGDPDLRQKDSSNKHSYIFLRYDDSYRIERLSLAIRHPILYSRTARIIDPDDSTTNLPVATIRIDPHDTVFQIPAIKTRHLLIDITNADNAALNISKVATAQSEIYILTHLEDGGDYELEGGSPLADKPDYDLHYFTDSLHQQPMLIGLKAVYFKTDTVATKESAPSDNKPAAKHPGQTAGSVRSTILLWSVILIALFLLSYLSIKLVKAIPKKDAQDRL